VWLVAFSLERQLDQSLDGHFHIHIFIAVMANNLFESRHEGYALVIGKVPLKGFFSEHGVANFQNVPYATYPYGSERRSLFRFLLTRAVLMYRNMVQDVPKIQWASRYDGARIRKSDIVSSTR
jgi:hypothetical protein